MSKILHAKKIVLYFSKYIS